VVIAVVRWLSDVWSATWTQVNESLRQGVGRRFTAVTMFESALGKMST
jgi:hypothetical protein